MKRLTDNIAIALVAGVALLGTAAPEGRSRGRIRVALVQGGGERGLLAVEREDAGQVFRAHLRASERRAAYYLRSSNLLECLLSLSANPRLGMGRKLFDVLFSPLSFEFS